MTDKFYYECSDCHSEYPGNGVIYLCPVCKAGNLPGEPPKGVLKTVYDYNKIRDLSPSGTLFGRLKHDHFLSLLPLNGMDCWPRLRIGNTPLYRFDIQDIPGPPFELYLKDDSQNPTFSFKDRASALVSAWAKENGIHTIIAASTGNAGSSLAGICASQGQSSVIFVPASAPVAKLTQIVMYGARLVPVKGIYDQAFDLSIKATELFGYYNRNTAYNPLTVEGKKTVSFELYEQLNCRLPDRIFVPTGDGVVLSGVYKGFEDLLNLGIIDRMPVIVAVQAEESPNLVDNLSTEKFKSRSSTTLADSISVDVPGNFYMSKGFLEQYDGEWIKVSDEEIIRASVYLSRNTGIFAEPAAAAAYAGMMKYAEKEMIPAGSRNVVLLTGSGLKDLQSVKSLIRFPEAIEPETEELKRVLIS